MAVIQWLDLPQFSASAPFGENVRVIEAITMRFRSASVLTQKG
jgi:hypothetical protein